MLLSTTEKLLPYIWKAGLVPFLWSGHGAGKSETIKRLAKTLNYDFVDVRLGLKEVGDLLGMIRGFDEHGRAKYSKPDWWPVNRDRPTIVFLDEMNRASQPVLQASFQLILDGAIGQHTLFDNVYLVAAGNPEGHDYNVTSMEPALVSRFIHCIIDEDDSEFFKYMNGHNVDTNIQQFLHKYVGMIGSRNLVPQLGIKPSRRSWIFVDRLLKTGIPENLMAEVISGIIGQEAGDAYDAFLKQIVDPVLGKDVVNDYPKVKDRILALVQPNNIQASTLNITCEDIGQIVLADGKDTVLTDTQKKNIGQFLLDLPDDIAYGITFEYLKKNHDLTKYLAHISELNDRIYACNARLQQP